ncbi:MAG: translation initiation factor IF-2 [Patescibacteria group bacterium]
MSQNIKKRPPVVAVLGHVDHGKSSLLEAIKNLKITDKESGGITQHMGAYMVDHGDDKITFIDTPGHAAFTSMRSRGAEVADIGILVIAADEGVKKQTKEAIKHLKDAEVPFIVAFNKMDKRGANVEKVKKELSLEGVMVESYGGDIPCVEVSAKENRGMDELLEMVVLLAEMEDIKSDYDKKASGVVIETHVHPKKGVNATLLVKEGTLRKGDIIGTDCCYGTVRKMKNFKQEEIEEATPSTPARTSGLKMNPHVGEKFEVFESKKLAKNASITEGGVVDFSEDFNSNGDKTLNLIVKADVLGSLEAIKNTLEKLPREKVGINVVSSGIGEVGENDVDMAKTCNGKILAYRVEIDKVAKDLARQGNIDIHSYDVIYNLVESVKEEMKSLLEAETIQEKIGNVKILEVFKTDKKRQILGGKAIGGDIEQGALVKVVRNKEEAGEGKLINLKKEEKDVPKIPERENFGMLYEGSEKVKEGDILVAYKEKDITPEL